MVCRSWDEVGITLVLFWFISMFSPFFFLLLSPHLFTSSMVSSDHDVVVSHPRRRSWRTSWRWARLWTLPFPSFRREFSWYSCGFSQSAFQSASLNESSDAAVLAESSSSSQPEACKSMLASFPFSATAFAQDHFSRGFIELTDPNSVNPVIHDEDRSAAVFPRCAREFSSFPGFPGFPGSCGVRG